MPLMMIIMTMSPRRIINVPNPKSSSALHWHQACGWQMVSKGKYIHDDADDQAWLVNGKRKYIHEPQVG